MIILASQSTSRKAMLDAAGVPYVACPTAVDERGLEAALGPVGAAAIAQALAVAKALAGSTDHPDTVVLGSDSLVEVAGRRFDKPASRDEAAEHLRFFSGQTMRLYSAAALARGGTVLWQDHALATLQVRSLSERFIADYLDHEWPAVAGCVGVFRIEARGPHLFDTIEGDQFTVLGMPLLKVLGALRDLGELPR
ncbi:MAG: Maf-like protein YceF [Pseudomonadota bacterium]|jgi:septum formation protein